MLPQLPFTLGCPVPGLSRWVTTTIFRFDPLIDWPADLDCALKWNTALKTFDGGCLGGMGWCVERAAWQHELGLSSCA